MSTSYRDRLSSAQLDEQLLDRWLDLCKIIREIHPQLSADTVAVVASNLLQANDVKYALDAVVDDLENTQSCLNRMAGNLQDAQSSLSDTAAGLQNTGNTVQKAAANLETAERFLRWAA